VIKKQNANKQQVGDRFVPISEGLFMREMRYGIRSVYFRTGVKDVLASFDQELNERRQQRFASLADVVHALEESQVDREFLLGNKPRQNSLYEIGEIAQFLTLCSA
jgi:hypothetical protein